MRCAVPSSKVGSCDSASAAAERDSGVDAAVAGLAGAACAGFAAPATAAPWPNAGAAPSIVAMAMAVILRMLAAPGARLTRLRMNSAHQGRSKRTGAGPKRLDYCEFSP